jgi:hypothetical protein
MMTAIKLILAILLFGCLVEFPYGYYQFVRFAAMVGFGYLAFNANEEGAKNDTGCVLYYKDNKGNLTYEINGLIFKINKTQSDYYDISVTDKNASLVNLIMLHAKAKLIDGIYYCYVFTETLKNGDKLVYNSNYFNEIYYEYWDEVESHSLNINQENKYSGKRTLINFNLLLDISQFRTFFIENNISPVNKNYVVGNPNYYY